MTLGKYRKKPTQYHGENRPNSEKVEKNTSVAARLRMSEWYAPRLIAKIIFGLFLVVNSFPNTFLWRISFISSSSINIAAFGESRNDTERRIRGFPFNIAMIRETLKDEPRFGFAPNDSRLDRSPSCTQETR